MVEKQHLRGLRSLGLVGLQFLSPFHLHGAVHDAIGSQGFEALHFHDHNLKQSHKVGVTAKDHRQTHQEETHAWGEVTEKPAHAWWLLLGFYQPTGTSLAWRCNSDCGAYCLPHGKASPTNSYAHGGQTGHVKWLFFSMWVAGSISISTEKSAIFYFFKIILVFNSALGKGPWVYISLHSKVSDDGRAKVKGQ